MLDISSQVLLLNSDLRSIYRAIRAGDTADPPIGLARRIATATTELIKADAAIGALGANPVERELRETALACRAAAWIHAWASFSLLVDKLGRSPLRGELLQLKHASSPSPLGLLLDAYVQMRRAATTSDEPLLAHLGGAGALLPLLLDYQHEWMDGERPDGVQHKFYIPRASDLIGAPTDSTAPRRDVIGLYALVHGQLDAPPRDEANQMRLADLRVWIEALVSDPRLAALDLVTKSPAQELRVRLRKIARFLEFRE